MGQGAGRPWRQGGIQIQELPRLPKGDDGQPDIVPEEAETIRLIYDRFLSGDSLKGIAELLEEKGIKSPTGKAEWQFSTIQSILSNERYKGDAIINKCAGGDSKAFGDERNGAW